MPAIVGFNEARHNRPAPGVIHVLTVHHLGISQSDRIVWLCEELAIPYQLIRYERDPVSRLAPAAYKKLHPFGTAPVITDGELVLGESGAIIEYVIARHGQGRLKVPQDSPDFPHFLYWFHFANGSMMTSAMVEIGLKLGAASADNPTLSGLRARNDLAWAMAEKRLGEAPYFGGQEFSAADIIMMFPLTTMRGFAPRDLSNLPHIRAFLQRIGGRPAYRRAMEKADPGFKAPLS
jgi:glutathione S-transferase